jgi:uncharacterized protein YlxW (UPF0749 family)
MLKTGNRAVLFVVFAVLGILVAAQFKATLNKNQLKNAAALNIERLTAQINNEKKIISDIKLEIDENIAVKEEHFKVFMEKSNDDKLLSEWEDARLKAGFTDVKGPGIVIKLDDALARGDTDTDLLLIHDQDIKIILNELKKAGAQAIAINGERIVATSEQLCAGSIILINRNRYPVPYIISAIGDPVVLFDTLSNCERIQLMIEDKIRVEIKRSNEVLVPKFSSIDRLNNFISALEVIEK